MAQTIRGVWLGFVRVVVLSVAWVSVVAAQDCPLGTPCGPPPANSMCQSPNTCDAMGGCTVTHFQCGAPPANPECQSFNTCDAGGACTVTHFQPTTTQCGAAPANPECQSFNTCDGAGACTVTHFEPITTVCTDTQPEDCLAAKCDGQGTCDQAAAAGICPAPAMSRWGLLMTTGALIAVGWVAIRWRLRRSLQPQPR